jgi:hypothetical protein
MPKITDYDMGWYGRQTIENTPAIAARLEHMLKGKRFTLASTHDGFDPERESGFKVSTGLRVEDKPFTCDTSFPHEIPCAGFAFRYTPTGGYGYWGVTTYATDGTTQVMSQKAYVDPYWWFDRGGTQARVAHRVPSGALVVDIFAIEMEDEDEQG